MTQNQAVETCTARLGQLNAERRAAVALLRKDAREKVVGFVEREYVKGFSMDQIGDRFLKIAKVSSLPAPFVNEAENVLVQLGWKPKRERA
jgi:hypothetical protein